MALRPRDYVITAILILLTTLIALANYVVKSVSYSEVRIA
jgi:hypothetical protein